MASRKDFASKKRSPKPARKPSGAKAAPAKPAAPKFDSAPVANKKSWKLILASLVALSLIGLLLQQLINIDPREIRETGISALIEEKASTEVTTPVSPTTPPTKHPKRLNQQPPKRTPTQTPLQQQLKRKIKHPLIKYLSVKNRRLPNKKSPISSINYWLKTLWKLKL